MNFDLFKIQMWHLLPFDVPTDVENVHFTIMQVAEW